MNFVSLLVAPAGTLSVVTVMYEFDYNMLIIAMKWWISFRCAIYVSAFELYIGSVFYL